VIVNNIISRNFGGAQVNHGRRPVRGDHDVERLDVVVDYADHIVKIVHCRRQRSEVRLFVDRLVGLKVFLQVVTIATTERGARDVTIPDTAVMVLEMLGC